MTWELSLTGLLIGLLVGVTGMGGGSLMTPILVLVFDFNVVLAVGTDILHGAIFKTIGALRHRVLGHVHARLTFWLALGSVPSSLLGVYVVELLKDTYGEDVNDVAARILGIALVLGAVSSLGRFCTVPRLTSPTTSPTETGSPRCSSGLRWLRPGIDLRRERHRELSGRALPDAGPSR